MTRVLALLARDQGEGYPRAAALIAAARHAGCDVDEVLLDLPAAGRDKQVIARSPWLWPGFAVKLRRARRRGIVLLRERLERAPPDVVLVLYPGHALVRWARSVFPGRIVLDLFLTAHDTLVLDRNVYSEGSLFAKLLARMDARACAAADLVILDTAAHADRVAELTGLGRDRFDHVPVADIAAPSSPSAYCGQLPGQKLELLFFGTGVPLHGLATLIEGVERVPGVRLTLVGGTQADRDRAARLPPGRVMLLENFVGRPRIDQLISSAHLVAGIFGTSRKADLVVPLKVMHALSHGRPVVTGESLAMRELLRPGEDVLTVERGNPTALAELLRSLLDAPHLLQPIARRARARFDTTFSIAATAERFATCLRDRIGVALRKASPSVVVRPEPVTVS